jgi:hypothetical protein
MNRLLKFKEFSNKLAQYEALQEMMKLDEYLGLYDDILDEGGAYGHIMHPFEDMNLTMADLHSMIQMTVNGSFTEDNFLQSKTDGQQLSISWKDGKIIAARNKSHLKNSGENAMDSKGVADLFAGRGDIETVYNAAMKDLEGSIGKLSEKDKEKYFANGSKFASLEIITPVTQNTVPYGQNLLVFHGVLEYDIDGNVTDEDKQAGRDLGKLVADANLASQETFFVRGPEDVEIKPFKEAKLRSSYYENKYKQILKDCNLGESSTVYDYALGMGRNVIKEEAEKSGVSIPADALDGLAMRIADINKSFSASAIKKSLGDNANWFIDLEKKSAKDLKARVYSPLESLFLEVGTELMKGISSALVANPTDAADAMKKEIDKTISTIRTNGDESDIEKLERQLRRLTDVGGLEDIIPSEGITFVYKGRLYKYTGLFAICHQIRSILAYKK